MPRQPVAELVATAGADELPGDAVASLGAYTGLGVIPYHRWVLSPDGQRLLTAHSNGWVEVWSGSRGKRLGAFRLHIDGKRAEKLGPFHFSPSGRYLLATYTGESDQTHLVAWKYSEPFDASLDSIWHTDGLGMATLSNRRKRAIEVVSIVFHSDELVFILTRPKAPNFGSRDMRTLPSLEVRKLGTGERMAKIDEAAGKMAVSESGEVVYVAGQLPEARKRLPARRIEWRTGKSEPLSAVGEHFVRYVAVSPDGTRALVMTKLPAPEGARDPWRVERRVVLWDLEQGRAIVTLPSALYAKKFSDHHATHVSLTFSQDSRWVVATTPSHGLVAIDARQGLTHKKLSAGPKSALSCHMPELTNATNSLAVRCGQAYRLLDVTSAGVETSVDVSDARPPLVSAIAFSGDSRRLVVEHRNAKPTVWELSSSREVRTFPVDGDHALYWPKRRLDRAGEQMLSLGRKDGRLHGVVSRVTDGETTHTYWLDASEDCPWNLSRHLGFGAVQCGSTVDVFDALTGDTRMSLQAPVGKRGEVSFGFSSRPAAFHVAKSESSVFVQKIAWTTYALAGDQQERTVEFTTGSKWYPASTISPDGRWLELGTRWLAGTAASAGNYMMAKGNQAKRALYDAESGKLFELSVPERRVDQMSALLFGDGFAAARAQDEDGAHGFAVWRLDEKPEPFAWVDAGIEAGDVRAWGISPDGSLLAAGTWEGNVLLYPVR